MQINRGKQKNGKTREHFKKIRDTKEIYHAIKDRNDTDLTEAEEIRRGGKNTQNYTKDQVMIQITMIVCSLTYNHICWKAKSSGP